MTTGQISLFSTPEERTSAAYNARLDAFMAERAVPGGWQCPDCGGVSTSETRYWRDHGLMGTRCMRAPLSRNHARYALRTGDLALWVAATADLRAIARWRASGRPAW